MEQKEELEGTEAGDWERRGGGSGGKGHRCSGSGVMFLTLLTLHSLTNATAAEVEKSPSKEPNQEMQGSATATKPRSEASDSTVEE